MKVKRWARTVAHPIALLDSWWEEVAPKRRIDRIPSNLCVLVGLMLPTFVIIFRGPAPATAVANMSVNMQVAMCSCIFIGCAIKLHGACLGARWYLKVRHLQQAYRWGYTGAPAAVAGLGVYTYYLFLAAGGSVWNAISVCLTPALGIGIGLNGVMYWLESRRIDRAEKSLTERKIAELSDERDADS